MTALNKTVFWLFVSFASITAVSCGDSAEEKYIDLLEQRIGETKAAESPEEPIELLELDVVSETKELVSFLCPSVAQSVQVRAKQLSVDKWLVNISFELQGLDEFGFPMMYRDNQILHVKRGKLQVDALLNLELPCE